ncbi:Penicillin-binding protein OS=Streptomyces alboniger OX=132473 GN=CP975_14530 PE=3 SV=1 [Streptomyces alboniger]
MSRAAAATSDTEAATALLTGYTKDAHLKDVTLTAGTRTGDKVPFSVKATVSYKGTEKPLKYDSALTVVRDTTDGKPRVDWHSSVVHPDLKDGDTLVTGASGTPPVKAVDRDGGEITTAKYPSLGTVLDGLREKYGKTAGGKAGIELRVIRGKSAKAAKASDKTLLELSKGTPGTVKTTLNPTLQAAAERQVAKKAKSSVVLMRPSTGEILAVANASHGFNIAFQGSLAPGSTMKVITSSLLIDKGLASADKAHPCPKYFKYGGWKFQNDDKFEIKGGTFKASFARSCNTAFISQAPDLDNGDLTKQAQQVFGLSMNNWAIGVPTFDGSVPVQSAAQMAASLIGQGQVPDEPAEHGVGVGDDGVGRLQAALPGVAHGRRPQARHRLPLDVLGHAVAAAGADVVHGGLRHGCRGDVRRQRQRGREDRLGGVDGQKKPNGWFTAYRGDLAAAGVVQQGGHGGDTAGPIVASLLKMGG